MTMTGLMNLKLKLKVVQTKGKTNKAAESSFSEVLYICCRYLTSILRQSRASWY